MLLTKKATKKTFIAIFGCKGNAKGWKRAKTNEDSNSTFVE